MYPYTPYDTLVGGVQQQQYCCSIIRPYLSGNIPPPRPLATVSHVNDKIIRKPLMSAAVYIHIINVYTMMVECQYFCCMIRVARVLRGESGRGDGIIIKMETTPIHSFLRCIYIILL